MDLIEFLTTEGKTGSWAEIGEKFGMTGEAARQKWKRHRKGGSKKTEPKLKLKSKWQAQTSEGVQWMESYAAISESEEFDTEKLVELIAKKVSYPDYDPKGYSLNGLLSVVNLYDLHLDKISLKGTKDPTGSFETNIKEFKDVTEEILDELWGLRPEVICVPLGNDLYHTNSFIPETKRGTTLDYYLDPYESYSEVTSLIIDFLHQLHGIAPLYIPMLKGNHDEDKVFILGYWLDQLFKEIDTVTIDFTMDQRKYYKFGKNLLGFAHGDKEKRKINELPLIMAQEEPKLWGETKYRKFFCGDLHHTQTFKFLSAKDYPGVEINYLRGLSQGDRWHHDHGWVGIPRTAYLHTFQKERGEIRVDKFTI